MSADALYQAVKSGTVKLDDLNDDGKYALSQYMNENHPMLMNQGNDFSTMNDQTPAYLKSQGSDLSRPATSNAQSVASGDARTDYPGGLWNPLNDLGHLSNSPLLSHFTYSAGKAMGVPDDMMSADKSTGNSLLDKAVGFAGGTAGYLTNPAQIEQNVGNTFFNNPIATSAGNRLGNLADSALAKLTGSDVSQTLEGSLIRKSAQGVAQIGVGSAAYAPFQTLNNGGDIQDIPQAMLDQGLQGAAFGAAGGLLGGAASHGLGALATKYAGTKLGDALGSFFGNSNPIAPETTQPTLALPEGRGTQRFNAAKDRGNLSPNTDPIYGQGDIHTFALPESPQYNEIQRIEAQQTLGLPEAQTQTMADYNRRNGNVLPTNEAPVYGQGNIHTFGLPEPKLSDATTARRVNSTPNGYLNLYDQLHQEVNNRIASGDIKPVDNQGYANLQQAIEDGYKNNEMTHEEYLHMRAIADQELSKQRDLYNESVKSVYSQIAPKDAPPLDTLINEAYTPKKPVSGDLLSRARSQQSSRLAAGVDLPVKSLDQRYTEANNGNRLGATGNVAMMANKVGTFGRVRPEIKPKQTEPFQETPQQTMQRAEQQLKEAADRKRISDLSKPIIGRAAMPETKVGFAPKPLEKGKALNSDAKLPQPIKLTPKQIAKNERADNFSRVENNPILPDTAPQIQSKTGSEKVPLSQRASDIYTNTVDNLNPIHNFDETVKKATGSDLNPSDSSYKLALNSRGSDMVSRQILESNMVDSQGNVIGDSLKSVAEQIPKGQQQAFEDYLVAQHAITRMGRGEKVYNDNLNMTIQKAQAKVDAYEKSNPQFKQAADAYYNYNQKLGQAWLVDTGLLSQKQWDGYLAANPHYVPNQRVFSDLEKGRQFGSKGGFADQTVPVKKAEGSQRQIVSPIESTIENTAKYVKVAKQNEVMQALYNNLTKDPEALKSWAEIVHDEPKGDVSKLLHEEGPDGLLHEVSKSFDSALQKPDLTHGNIVSALINGERVHMRINDPHLLEALTNISPQAQPKWLAAIGRVTKVMKNLTTGINPVFGLTKNIWKDIPHAYISSKSTDNIVTFGRDIIGSFIDVMGNREAYQSYKNIGGGHSSSIAADRNLLAQSKEKILPSSGLKQTAKRLITKPYHALENFNNAIETAPRLAEYKRLAADGSYDSKVNALYQANDLTTNFNKFGNTTKSMDAFVPYLNASIQGLDQLGRMFKNDPVKTSLKAIAAITVPQAILYAVNHNDPNYNQLSSYIKDNNFLIPKGDGTFWKIPKPREMGMVFGSGIERAMKAWNDQDPAAFKGFTSDLIQNFAPPGVGQALQGGNPLSDTIAGPTVSLLSNKDFAGRPIVPQALQSLSPSLQYDSKTSEPAKFLGSLVGLSPKKLDYLAKSYLGVIGQLGIPATTANGSVGGALLQQVTADPVFSNDISSDFYNAKGKADMAKADAKATGQYPQQDLSSYYDRIASNLSSFRKEISRVQADNTTSKADKIARVRDLTIKMNDIQKQSLVK